MKPALNLRLCLAALALLILQACASLTAPRGTADVLAYTQAAVTAARTTTASLLERGRITPARAESVNTQADQAMAAIKAARAAHTSGDAATAQAQLALAAQILAAIETQLKEPQQ